jgi:selenocysteine-specific elongation factor
MRTALNIPDVPLAGRGRKAGVARGHVITLPRLGGPHPVVDVWLEKSSRPVRGQAGFSHPVKNGQHVRFHHGSASHEGRVFLLDSRTLEPGSTALAELRLRAPVHVFAGDRFVLRDWSKRFTIAGGLVLDPEAQQADFRKSRQGAFLKSAAAAPHDPASVIRALVTRDRALVRDGLLVKSRFSEADVRKAVEFLVKEGSTIAVSGWLLDAAWWAEVTERAASLIRQHHKQHPETQGLGLTQLRAELGRILPQPRLFDVLVSHLSREGFARNGELIRSGLHRAVLPLALESAGQRLREALAGSPFDPPAPADLAPTPTDQRTLKFLIDNGEVVELGGRAVVSREAYHQMRERIVSSLRQRTQATASELREAIGTTRRIIIPLLERLDREGVTRRSGDYRTLGPHV